MHHWPWRAMMIGAVATVLIYTATRPDPDTSGLTQATSDQLIDQLSSSREVVQRAAASRLISQGVSALPALEAATAQAPEGQLRQIFLVLEDMYLSADQRVADAVEDTVEKLESNNRHEVRRLAESLFAANKSRRQMRAYAKIESLSGILIVRPMMPQSGRHETYPNLVVIGADWKGGDDGLKYLARMQGLHMVHIGTEAPLSEEAIRGLKSVVPAIRRESEGCLGVELRGLSIHWVVPKSPAERAGLQRYDGIIKLNGQPVEDYLEFQQILRSQRPGDTVQLEIAREGDVFTKAATLGSDFGTGRCRCQGDADEPLTAETPRGSGRRLSPLSDHFISPMSDEQSHMGHFSLDLDPGLEPIPR